jgi:hypothetical protein
MCTHSANLDFQIFHAAAMLYSYDIGCRFHAANHNPQCQYTDQIYSSDGEREMSPGSRCGLLDGEMIELAWKTSDIRVSIFFPLLSSVNKVSLRPNCERLQASRPPSCIYRSFTPSCFCGRPFVPRIDQI